MIDNEFIAFRDVANRIEDEFQTWKENKTADFSLRVDYLSEILDRSSEPYERVCILRMLGGELITHCPDDEKDSYLARASDVFRELYETCSFDPVSISDCAIYFLEEEHDEARARNAATYGALVAERIRAHVRHSHQTLFRIAIATKDIGLAEVAIRRISEYRPQEGSPDPCIESDIVDAVSDLPIKADLKAIFFRALDAERNQSS